jgi:hypothetical protein
VRSTSVPPGCFCVVDDFECFCLHGLCDHQCTLGGLFSQFVAVGTPLSDVVHEFVPQAFSC